jgi:hypothetical protein
MKRKALLAGVVGSLCLAGRVSAETLLYSNNFDGPGTTFISGVTATPGGVQTTTAVQGFAGGSAGPGSMSGMFSGQMLYNPTNPPSASTFTFTNLPTHTAVNIRFLLAVIDSWDGVLTDRGYNPDFFNVNVDGTTVLQASYDNYSDASGDGIAETPAGSAIFQRQPKGFNSSFLDSAYFLGGTSALQNIPHTASTLTVSLFASGAGWQGGTDESWGIDNLRVGLEGVPDGAAVPLPGVATAGTALMGLAGGMNVLRRGRRARD